MADEMLINIIIKLLYIIRNLSAYQLLNQQNQFYLLNLSQVLIKYLICILYSELKQQSMGSLCQPEVKKKEIGEVNLMGSDLMISKNLNNVINLRKQDLRISAYPIYRKNEVNKTSLILVVSKQMSPELLVRFYLIYSFYISKYIENSKERPRYEQNFYQLTKVSHQTLQEQQKVKKFKAQFSKETNDVKKDLLMVNTLFTSKFIIENTNKIPLFTDDPKDIGHLIFPIARLFRGIKKNHETFNLKKTDLKPIYIVAVLEADEQNLLKSISKEAYFSFSIFMRGFTSEKFAEEKVNAVRKEHSSSKVYLFIINFPFGHQKMESAYDNGYYIYPNADLAIKKEGDVIFNIMNTFKVAKNDMQSREIELQYGYLPHLYYLKYQERDPQVDADLIKIFQLCKAVARHYLKSQSFLFRIIGGKDDSMNVSNAILNIPASSPANNDIQRQNLINNILDDGNKCNYQQALNTSQKGQSFMLKAKQLQVLYEQKQFEKVSQLLAQLNKNPAKKDSKNSEANEMIEYINARLQIREKRFKAALTRLKSLQQRMKSKYGNDYEFIGRDVISSIEECYKKGEPRPTDPNEVNISPVQWSIKSTNLNLRSISV